MAVSRVSRSAIGDSKGQKDIAALSDFAVVTSASGAGYSKSYYNNYEVHKWTSGTGNITIGTAGYADVLVVGGGGGGDGPDRGGGASGGAGSVIEKRVWLIAANYGVYVGGGGSQGGIGDGVGGTGSYMSCVPNTRTTANGLWRLSAPAGGGGTSQNTPGTLDYGGDSGDGYIHNNGTGGAVGTGAGAGGYNSVYIGGTGYGTGGVWSSITGTAVEYGKVGLVSPGTPGSSGYGGSFGGCGPGFGGIVVVRVRI